MRLRTLLLPTCLLAVTVHAQVLFDFEDGNIAQWYSEGDGDFGLNPTDGHPGQCLQVNDDATGDMVILITPYALIGDWSSATVNDSISYDLKPISSDPDVIANDPYLIQLNGPGGTAIALPDFMPVMNQWQRVSVPIDPAAWTVTSGSWDALLANVSLIRIRAEFITGDEYTLMDNVGLSFSPVLGALGTPQTCSSFDESGNMDGWGFDAVSAVAVDSTLGLPPNALRVGDAPGILGIAMAPPKFRGDWSAVDGTGTIDLDIQVQTSATLLSERPFVVRISGTGGAATINVTDDQVEAARNTWAHWTLPIEESAWTLESGSWAALLQGVAEVRVQVEYFNGDETVYLDNFCIGQISGAGIGGHAARDFTIRPNPVQDYLLMPVGAAASAYEVLDANGSLVLKGSVPAAAETRVDVRALQPGIYVVRLIGRDGTAVARFLK